MREREREREWVRERYKNVTIYSAAAADYGQCCGEETRHQKSVVVSDGESKFRSESADGDRKGWRKRRLRQHPRPLGRFTRYALHAPILMMVLHWSQLFVRGSWIRTSGWMVSGGKSLPDKSGFGDGVMAAGGDVANVQLISSFSSLVGGDKVVNSVGLGDSASGVASDDSRRRPSHQLFAGTWWPVESSTRAGLQVHARPAKQSTVLGFLARATGPGCSETRWPRQNGAAGCTLYTSPIPCTMCDSPAHIKARFQPSFNWFLCTGNLIKRGVRQLSLFSLHK